MKIFVILAALALAGCMAGCAKEPVIHSQLSKPDAELMAPKSKLPALPLDANIETITKDAARVSSVCVYDQRRLTDLQKYVRTITKD